ncbi:MAG: alpha-amylase, partial [Methylocella sp.]
QGDARSWMLDALKRSLEAAALTSGQDSRAGLEEFAAYVPHMRRLGICTAGMHVALATPCADPAFKAEALTLDDVRAVAESARSLAKRAFPRLRTIAASFSGVKRADAERLLGRRQECLSLISKLVQQPHGAIKIRVHGNFRLGRLLVAKDDLMIVDFGGGGRSVAVDQRRAKASPLRDVASMLRSFVHAVAAAKQELARLLPDPEHGAARLREELIEFSQIFIRAYWEAARESPIWIEDESTRRRLLVLYLLAEMLHDIESAAENRPEGIDMSIESVNTILDRMAIA